MGRVPGRGHSSYKGRELTDPSGELRRAPSYGNTASGEARSCGWRGARGHTVEGFSPRAHSVWVCRLGSQGRGVVTWWLLEQPGLGWEELEGEALRECSPFGEFPCLSSDMGCPVRGWVGGSGARRQHVLSIYFSHLSRQFCILRVQRPLLRPLALLPPNKEGEDQHLTPSMRCPLNPRDIRFHRTPPAGPCPGPTPPLSQLASACSP